jgi:methyl-accepting chemotaxis protein
LRLHRAGAIINTSVEKVEDGSSLVAQAGETMNEIVGSVQRVTDIMGEITAAATEQADGIAQVNAAVAQLDQMTQQNAALVEQSAAAASSMKDQAHRLAGVVSAFKLDARTSMVQPQAMATRKAPRPPASAPKKPIAPPAAKPALAGKKAAPAVQPKLAAPAAQTASAKANGSQGDDDWETF